jgi:very-short-patch-repair endonuclease
MGKVKKGQWFLPHIMGEVRKVQNLSTIHPRWRASVQIQQRARELRKNLTPAEQKLWQHLRRGQIDGLHWRKQHAVGTYIVDFFCAKARLVVEVDGDSHADQIEYDEKRTAYLNEFGLPYTVIRFTNREVLHQCEAVVQQIADECQRLMGRDQIQQRSI